MVLIKHISRHLQYRICASVVHKFNFKCLYFYFRQVICDLHIVGESRVCAGLMGWAAAGVDILAKSQS